MGGENSMEKKSPIELMEEIAKKICRFGLQL